MEDIWFLKQVWLWLRSQEDACWRARTALCCCRDKTLVFIEQHWPMVCSWFTRLVNLLRLSLLYWKDCAVRGFQSFIKLGSAMLLLIMWSCLLSLTSMYCLVYVLISMVCSLSNCLNLAFMGSDLIFLLHVDLRYFSFSLNYLNTSSCSIGL